MKKLERKFTRLESEYAPTIAQTPFHSAMRLHGSDDIAVFPCALGFIYTIRNLFHILSTIYIIYNHTSNRPLQQVFFACGRRKIGVTGIFSTFLILF